MSHGYEVPVTATTAGDVIYIGSSPALQEARNLASSLGYGQAHTADTAVYAVVDEDALDGMCTATEATLLVQVRLLNVPVLTAHEARTHFRTEAPLAVA